MFPRIGRSSAPGAIRATLHSSGLVVLVVVRIELIGAMVSRSLRCIAFAALALAWARVGLILHEQVLRSWWFGPDPRSLRRVSGGRLEKRRTLANAVSADPGSWHSPRSCTFPTGLRHFFRHQSPATRSRTSREVGSTKKHGGQTRTRQANDTHRSAYVGKLNTAAQETHRAHCRGAQA